MGLEHLSEQERQVIQNELNQWYSEEFVQEISEEEIIKMQKEARGY